MGPEAAATLGRDGGQNEREGGQGKVTWNQ